MVWIKNFKLRVNIARFGRKKVSSVDPSPTEVGVRMKAKGSVNKSSNPVFRSYAEALTGRHDSHLSSELVGSGSSGSMKEIINLNSIMDCSQSLNGLLFGVCKSFEFLKGLKDCFREEGWGDLALNFLGGLAVSIQFPSREVAETFVEENKSIWSCWLSKLHVWDSSVAVDNRLAAVHISGVPLPELESPILSEICKHWGVVVDELDSEWGEGRIPCYVLLSQKLEWIHIHTKVKVGEAEILVSVTEDPTKSIKVLSDLSLSSLVAVDSDSDSLNSSSLPEDSESSKLPEKESGDGKSEDRRSEPTIRSEKEGRGHDDESSKNSALGSGPATEESPAAVDVNLMEAVGSSRAKNALEPASGREAGSIHQALGPVCNDVGDSSATKPTSILQCPKGTYNSLRRSKSVNSMNSNPSAEEITGSQKMKFLEAPCKCNRKRGKIPCEHSGFPGSVAGEAFLVRKGDECYPDEGELIASSNRRNWKHLSSDSFEDLNKGTVYRNKPISEDSHDSLLDLGELLGFSKDFSSAKDAMNSVLESTPGTRHLGGFCAAILMKFADRKNVVAQFLIPVGRPVLTISLDLSMFLNLTLEAKHSKLDRFLLSRGFLDVWNKPGALAIQSIYSDHNPIILDTGDRDFGPIPFKFYNSWILSDSLAGVVTRSRVDSNGFGGFTSDILKLSRKLKTVKLGIKEWRKSVLGERSKELKDLKTKHNSLETLEDAWGLSAEERYEKDLILGKIHDLEGRKTWMHGLMINGVWSDDPTILKSYVFGFFQEKYKENAETRLNFRSSQIRRITDAQKSYLTASFSMEELKGAVWSCGGEKAPGPDGFSFAFLRKFWDTISADFFAAVKEFQQDPFRVAACNNSFISLIPKVKDPLSLNEYRPIHLMGCISKVISKMLAERLKLVVGDVISSVQTAFVKGRKIMDGPLIVNEVDFEKAFDNVRWEYLWKIMSQMNFGNVWISWMKGLICTAKVSVLVNGAPSKEFALEKGVRQGDPLSPCFHLASGLRINWEKSTLTGIGVPPTDLSYMAAKVGCKGGKLPFIYLGFPIGDNMRKKASWSPLFKKFDGRIAWVDWEKVLNSRDKGGLGIGSLRAQNIALLAKWWWRFKTEDDTLWKSVIVSIHGSSGQLGTTLSDWTRRGTWGYIATLQDSVMDSNIHLDSLFQRHLEGGRNIRFWLDIWVGNNTLADRFPRLAALDEDISCCIADRIVRSTNGAGFLGRWRRPLREGRETEDEKEIDRACQNLPIHDTGEGWSWGLNDSGTFSVASLRKAFDDMTLKRKVAEVRRAVNSWRNLLPLNTSNMKDFWDEIIEGGRSDENRTLKVITGHAYIWAIWTSRNDVVFNRKIFNPLATANLVQSLISLWCFSRSKKNRCRDCFSWRSSPFV
ncbi:hypothetical protein OSB04_012378 [Centaurea solstitialis]|uniref:Reverse transcriptase domain-containing protein n=1 Tax=Centaurea solstitialis TaxID=347529 RepID=A0AA38WPY3_9ASTR|nr:hypothetical protein OSB04_012378 [Centaurea solstitialis]